MFCAQGQAREAERSDERGRGEEEEGAGAKRGRRGDERRGAKWDGMPGARGRVLSQCSFKQRRRPALCLFVSEFVSALVSFQMLFAPTPVDLEIAER